MPPTLATRLALAAPLVFASGLPAPCGARAQGRPGQPKQAQRRGGARAREARERREAAAAAVEAADAARQFEDPEDRADVQARAADLLWPHDAQTARAVFMRAWAAAGEADEAARAEEAADAEEGGEPAAATYARNGLLPVAAKHDPPLAEKLLKALIGEEEEQARKNEQPARASSSEGGATTDPTAEATRKSPWGGMSPAGMRRLELASTLVRRGDYESAARVAAPLASEGASFILLKFLYGLRAKNPAGADDVYLRLVAQALSAPRASANDVLLLSSYIVSPHAAPVVNPDGWPQFGSLDARGDYAEAAPAAPEVPQRVRAAFLNSAASVLLRPSSADADPVARFFAVGRLLPFFEREAPQHAAALHARRAALAAEVEVERREQLAAQAEVRPPAPRNSVDPLGLQLEYARGLKDEAERDGKLLVVVQTAAAHKLWDRSRKTADEIKDPALRRDAHSVVTGMQVLSTFESFEGEKDEKDWERALAFVRAADVPPLVRALGLAQAAELAARRGGRERAAEIVREAVSFAEQLEPYSVERFSALASVSVTAARADVPQVWELVAETARLAADFETRDAFSKYLFAPSDPVTGADIKRLIYVGAPIHPEAVFAAAARLDLSRALAEARTLKEPVTRAYALIAVARERLGRAGAGSQTRRKAVD